jgi:hypothetical protein
LDGDIADRLATLFTVAFDQATGVGTCLAMESFEGSVGGLTGALNFASSAPTSGGTTRPGTSPSPRRAPPPAGRRHL